jgi:uncharacterized protein (TIGR03089 family)
MTDAWSALQARKRENPGAPVVTYLDAIRGERVELSATTLENAAAKIANALRDEFDFEQGSSICLRLPLHWQRAAWVGGIWTAGCCIVLDDASLAELVVVGERTLEDIDPSGPPVLVVSQHPFGLPITAPLPAGVADATHAVRAQPDAFMFEPPHSSLAALQVEDEMWTQERVWERAAQLADEWGLVEGGRLLVADDLDPRDSVIACLAVPLVGRGSVVLAAEGIERAQVIESERITAIAAPPR